MGNHRKAMETNVLLGFDARRGQSICTVDVNLWPRIEDSRFDVLVASVSKLLNRSLVINHVNLLACIPKEWIRNPPTGADSSLVGVFSTKEHVDRLCALYPKMLSDFPCSITKDELLKAGWTTLGYDIVDLTLSTSWQACNGIQPSDVKYRVLSETLVDIDMANREVPEHAPFAPVEIVVNRRINR